MFNTGEGIQSFKCVYTGWCKCALQGWARCSLQSGANTVTLWKAGRALKNSRTDWGTEAGDGRELNVHITTWICVISCENNLEIQNSTNSCLTQCLDSKCSTNIISVKKRRNKCSPAFNLLTQHVFEHTLDCLPLLSSVIDVLQIALSTILL
jgi:hypothetical protein